jgi:ABC-2 type transport system ATP-binding protein
LNEGRVAFNGTPADLVANVGGKVWNVSVTPEELDVFKTKYLVTSAIPSEAGYQLRLVADDFSGGSAEAAEPNLEDAYVYFMHSKAGRICELAEPSALG